MSRSLVILGLTAGILVGSALAGETKRPGFPGDVPDNGRIQLAFFQASLATNFAVNPDEVGLGVLVSFESAGLDRNVPTFDLSGYWRVGRRSSIYFDYVDISRSADKTLGVEYDLYGHVFQAGTSFHTEFDSSFIAVGYRYDAYDNGEVRIGGEIGLTRLDFRLRARGEGQILDPEGVLLEGAFDKTFDLEAPAPQIGAALDWAFSRRGVVGFYWRTLVINIGDLKGSFSDAGISATWFAGRRVGFGLGVEKESVNVKEYTGKDYKARGGYDQSGAIVYVTFAL